MDIRLASTIQEDSIVDGEGLRAIIWTQGCPHNCLGCHNPQTHDFDSGFLKKVDDLKKDIKELELVDGITLSGGEPFAQAKACAEIAKFSKKLGLNVWSYTGYTFEQLLKMAVTNEDILSLLENIDVLVDGKFMLELKTYDSTFRGSSNQRIIDVKKSLATKKAILVEKYNKIPLEEKKQKIYI